MIPFSDPLGLRKRRAMQEAIAEHLDSVYRFLRNLTGSEEDARDLAQETFLEADKSIGGFRAEANLRTWLHRIAYRRFQRWKLGRISTSPASAEPATQSGDFRIDLDRALANLHEDRRIVFVLAEIVQLDLSEISEMLEVPLGTVKSRLYRAKADLRIALSEPDPNEENHVPAYR